MNTFRTIGVCIILGAAIVAAYQPVTENALVWDDKHTIVQTEHYSRLDAASIEWMFTTTLGGHYQPLTWLSFALDHRLWGRLSAQGIHLTNVLLHWMTACGFFFVCLDSLRRAEIKPGVALPAALAASLWWAVHPLRVESVAWATERRDVLSGVFLILTVICYLRYARAGARRRMFWLIAAALCYPLSLLSKAAGITLPLVLMLLDCFPLRRSKKPLSNPGNARAIGEKLIFVLPAVVIAFVAVCAQSASGALRSLDEHPLSLRLIQGCYGVVFYLGKLAWPSNLLPLYEQDPQATAWEPSYLASLAVIILLTVFFLSSRKHWPGLLTCWLAYLLLLLPVLGLAQSGPQLVADRYTYLAAMPWAVLLACFCAKFWERIAHRPATWLWAGAAMAAIALMFIAQSRGQVRVWRDEYTLWSTVAERAPHTGMAQANLALELNRRGDYALAIEHARLALVRLPGNRAAHLALGSAALQMGRYELAAQHLAIAVQIAEHIGRPDFAAMARLAAALGGLGDRAGAKETFERLLALNPREAEWEFQHGSFLASVEDYEGAREHLELAVQLRPSEAVFYVRLAIVHRRLGNDAAAVDTLRRGLQANPRDVELPGELAWILATTGDDSLRDGKQALSLAQAAVDAPSGASRRAKEALAAAHAEIGDFTSAIEIIQRELSADPNPPRRARLEEALALYQVQKPYRD